MTAPTTIDSNRNEARNSARNEARNEARDPGTADVLTPDHLFMFDLMHRAMRRHARVLQAALGRLRDGDVDGARQLADFWSHMRAEIVHHHTVEDTIFFPALLASSPAFAAISGRMHEDHEALDVVIDELSVALDEHERTGAAHADRLVAIAAATALVELLDDHLDREEGVTFPLFCSSMTASTYAGLEAHAVETVNKKEFPFVAPWLMAYASPAEADRVYATVPKIVKVLYKLSWRRKYARAYPLMAA